MEAEIEWPERDFKDDFGTTNATVSKIESCAE